MALVYNPPTLGTVTFSPPTYSGNGGNNVGATMVTVNFNLANGTTDSKTVSFTGVNLTTNKTQTPTFTIGGYSVTVTVNLTTSGNNNNQMTITGASAVITSAVLATNP